MRGLGGGDDEVWQESFRDALSTFGGITVVAAQKLILEGFDFVCPRSGENMAAVASGLISGKVFDAQGLKNLVRRHAATQAEVN